MAKHNVILVLFALLSTNLFSQSAQELNVDSIVKLVQQYTNDESPGVAVGIVKDGQIIYEEYWGYANLEHQVKIDQDTRFNIASNAKQYTALCILHLAEQDKLKLDDDFRTYIPDLFPNIAEKITIANLINHTSGIRDYCDLYGMTGKTWWKQFIDNEDALDLLCKQTALNFTPGTRYLYSNSNYIILAAIVAKVTGTKLGDFTKEMFEALEMPNTAFLTKYSQIIPHKARPYGNWNG